MALAIFLLLSAPLKDYLVLDLAPYPVSGIYVNYYFQSLGLEGDYKTSETFFDSLSSYKSVWVFTSANSQRWPVSIEAVHKVKEYLTLGGRGLYWQGYWDWFDDPGSPDLRKLMGVKNPRFYMWSFYISTIMGHIDSVFVNSFPWIMVDFKLDNTLNCSHYMLQGINVSRPGLVDVHTGVLGAIYDSKTVALGFDIAAIWGPTPKEEVLCWILEYFGISTSGSSNSAPITKLGKPETQFDITGRKSRTPQNGITFSGNLMTIYIDGSPLHVVPLRRMREFRY